MEFKGKMVKKRRKTVPNSATLIQLLWGLGHIFMYFSPKYSLHRGATGKTQSSTKLSSLPTRVYSQPLKVTRPSPPARYLAKVCHCEPGIPRATGR